VKERKLPAEETGSRSTTLPLIVTTSSSAATKGKADISVINGKPDISIGLLISQDSLRLLGRLGRVDRHRSVVDMNGLLPDSEHV